MRIYVLWLLVLVGTMGGCAVTQPQNTPVRQRYEIDPSTGRGFWIYVPSTYREDRPAPLIVSCHGTPPYDVAEHHIREWKMLGEQNGCIVVAPELIATDGLIGDGPIVGMLSCERYILSLISMLGYRYNIDRANVMITGFSGGGFPTYWVGLRHPDVFSVVAARNCNFSQANLDGWYPPEAKQTAIIVYYGQNDPGRAPGTRGTRRWRWRFSGGTGDGPSLPCKGANAKAHGGIAPRALRGRCGSGRRVRA